MSRVQRRAQGVRGPRGSVAQGVRLVFYEPPSSSPCLRVFLFSLISSAWDKQSTPRVGRPVPRFANPGEAGNRAAPDFDHYQGPRSPILPPGRSRLSKAFGLVASSKARPPGRRRLLYVLIIIHDQSQDNSTSCDARSQDWWANPSDPRLPPGMPDSGIAVAQPALYALDSRSRPSSTRRHYILL